MQAIVLTRAGQIDVSFLVQELHGIFPPQVLVNLVNILGLSLGLHNLVKMRNLFVVMTLVLLLALCFLDHFYLQI